MFPHKISVKTSTEWMHRRMEQFKPGDIGRPLRGLRNKACSLKEIKSSDGRLGEWLGGDWKLADNVGK